MRALALLFTSLTIYNLALSASTAAQNPAIPFENVSPRNPPDSIFLLKRQNACSSGFIQCTAVDSAVCCSSTAICTRDPSGNPACCRSGFVCTGGGLTAPATETTSSTSTSSSVQQGGTVTTTVSAGGDTTATPAPTAAPTVPTGYSTVPNPFYPFIQIPTTFANSQSCLSALTLCSSDSSACFSSLVGQNGVTISGVDSQGLTQPGVSGTVASGASSICSSLSLRGCYNLQSGQCSSYGSAGATETQGLVQSAAAAPALARCTGAIYTAAAAAVAGVGLVRIAGG